MRWLQKLLFFRRPRSAEDILKYPEGKRYYPDFHNIRKFNIDPDALKVIGRLQQFGYKAYLVGGGVRDFLIGRQPKDYDVVTNARPNEIRRVFANSRTIGKRFRIVHVVFRGSKIIEVSTARSLPPTRFKATDKDELYLTKDNHYGTFKEDAARRDFTINALFFDVRNETIIDYTGGFDDIKNKIVRIIGDPNVSLPEDPVRMLRAAKFGGWPGFKLHPKLERSIKKHRKLIVKASPARLHEEYNKIFRTAKTAQIFALMHELGLLSALFPELSSYLPAGAREEFLASPIGRRLEIADSMISEHEDVNTTIYYALVIADAMKAVAEEESKKRERETRLKETLKPLAQELALTRKESERLLQIFSSQHNFTREDTDRRGWVRSFKNRDFFLEAFIYYKINARAEGNDEAVQKALFWEIGLRKKLPYPIRPARSISLQSDHSLQSTEARPKKTQQSKTEPKSKGPPRSRKGRKKSKTGPSEKSTKPKNS